LESAPHIACVGPDIYALDVNGFRACMKEHIIGRNIPFVPEHGSDEYTPVGENLLAGLGEFGVIGMDLWAIDYPCGYWGYHSERKPQTPLFDPLDGKPAPHADAVAEVFGLVNRANAPIGARLGTEDLFAFVGQSDAVEYARVYPEGEIRVQLGPQGQGLFVRIAPHDYTILGRDCTVILPKGTNMAESGAWRGMEWGPAHAVAVDYAEEHNVLCLRTPDVVRLR
jgi:hypothetical protein